MLRYSLFKPLLFFVFTLNCLDLFLPLPVFHTQVRVLELNKLPSHYLLLSSVTVAFDLDFGHRVPLDDLFD